MSGDGDAREWGPWSVWKTEILLGAYLPLFAVASKRSDHRTFIDCFAGVNRNVERDTGREIKSSPRQALEEERRRSRSTSEAEGLFAAEDWETELAAAANNPTKYARLLTEDPQPYTPGATTVEEQLKLDW